MTTRADLARAVAALSAPPVIGRRLVEAVCRFDAFMRNDFMTPRGTPYKWQELRAGLARNVTGRTSPTLVPTSYTWLEVASRTGQRDPAPADAAWVPWNFARGQQFHAVLPHSDVNGRLPDLAEACGPSSGTRVSYPELLRSPSVDLLVMLSWDVLMFETMCTHLATAPELQHTGVPADLTRISGTWGNLQFSDPETAAVFQNTQMTATRMGYGMRDGRPSAVFSFQCLDCPLTTRAGQLSQDGRSSYWGTIQVDLRSGDLVAGEMVEVIVATQTDAGGNQVPVYRRRLVRMTAAGEVASDRPAEALGSAGLDLSAPDPVGADPAAGRELARDAGRVAGQVHSRLRGHVGSLSLMPDHMVPLAEMGLRSLVGVSGPEAIELVATLRADLRAWAGGDVAAAARVLAGWPTYIRTLEGLVAYCDASAGEAARMGNLDEATLTGLRESLGAFGDDLGRLIALLDRMAPDGVPA